MRIGPLSWILAVAALLAAPIVLAGENPVPPPVPGSGNECHPESSGCEEQTGPRPWAAPDLGSPSPEDSDAPKASLFDHLGEATAASVAVVQGAALAAVGAAAAVVSGYVDLLVSLRPRGMSDAMFLGAATGGTALAVFGVQFGAWNAWRRLAPLLAGLPGFSRIAKDELLENERRSRLYEMIRQNPGIRLGELARGLDLAWGTALHHLRKLRADRLITVQQAGHHKSYFINGSGLSAPEMQAASVLHGPTLQGVASWIREHPRTNLKQLASGLGISSPLAAFHVAKLQKAGLVQKVRDGRSIRLELSARLPAGSIFDLGAGPGLCPQPA